MTEEQEFDSYLESKSEKMTRLEMVKKFHKLFSLEIGGSHNIKNEELSVLRLNLIKEEVEELQKAMRDFLEKRTKINLESVLDALVDIEYVLLGAVISFGMDDIFDEAFEEVHKSNMSKLYKYTSEEQLAEEINYLRHKYGTYNWIFVSTEIKNTSIIRRLSDGKILKPSGYSPVSLGFLLKFPDNL